MDMNYDVDMNYDMDRAAGLGELNFSCSQEKFNYNLWVLDLCVSSVSFFVNSPAVPNRPCLLQSAVSDLF